MNRTRLEAALTGVGRALGQRWRTIAFGVGAVWIGLVIYPQPLFAYSVRRENLELFAREPLPPRAGVILEDAVRRLARSPLYDPGRKYNVFLCDSPALFAFFTLHPRVGGVTHPSGNSFLRPANVAHDRLIDTAGRERQGERTLTYHLTHEAAHAMTMAALGHLRFYSLARFQVEGYADHVAFDRRLDLAAGRAALQRGAPEMDFARSGLYRKYELLVAYLLDRRGMAARELLSARLEESAVEGQLQADRSMGQ